MANVLLVIGAMDINMSFEGIDISTLVVTGFLSSESQDTGEDQIGLHDLSWFPDFTGGLSPTEDLPPRRAVPDLFMDTMPPSRCLVAILLAADSPGCGGTRNIEGDLVPFYDTKPLFSDTNPDALFRSHKFSPTLLDCIREDQNRGFCWRREGFARGFDAVSWRGLDILTALQKR